MSGRQRFIIFAIVGIGLLAVAIAGALTVGILQITSRPSLEAAREQWAARTFDRYQMTLTSTSLGACPAEYIVEGREILVPDPLCPTHTVEELFQIVENVAVGECAPGGCQCGRLALNVDYHPELGYPIRIDQAYRRPLIQAPPFAPQIGCSGPGLIFTRLEVESLTPLP